MTAQHMYNAATYNSYDSAGRRTRMTWSADGSYIDYDYDTTGQMTAVRENGATSGVGVLATYGYDNVGRRSSITRGNGTVTNYAFDAASRLQTLSQDLAGTGEDQTVTLTYSPAGQIDSLSKSNDAYAWAGHYNVDRLYGTNGLNQLTSAGATSLGYDPRGNITSSGTSSYGYTSENRMATASNGTSIAYEPSGNQILQLYSSSTGADTRFAWDGDRINLEIGVSGNSVSILRRYVPGAGTDETVVWYEGAGLSDRRWLHTDERGSVTAITNSAGSTIRINTYDEYGIPAATNIGRFQYTGQAWFPELGLYYYKARIYSPTLGRFMQSDPIGYGDGMNWHNYVGSDPVNRTDPTGMICTTYNVTAPAAIYRNSEFAYIASDRRIATDSFKLCSEKENERAFTSGGRAGVRGGTGAAPFQKCPAVNVTGPGILGHWPAAILYLEFALTARQLSDISGAAADAFVVSRGIVYPSGEPNTHNNVGDAYRHFHWSFSMAQHWLGGEGKATALGNAHEVTAKNGASERAMDLFNNAMGRAFATDSRFAGLSPHDAAIAAIRNGCLITGIE